MRVHMPAGCTCRSARFVHTPGGPDHQGARPEDQAGHQGRDLRQGPGASLGPGLPARRPPARHGAPGTRAHHRQGRQAVGAARRRAQGLRQRAGRAARRALGPDFAHLRRDLPLLRRAARRQPQRHQRWPAASSSPMAPADASTTSRSSSARSPRMPRATTSARASSLPATARCS